MEYQFKLPTNLSQCDTTEGAVVTSVFELMSRL